MPSFFTLPCPCFSFLPSFLSSRRRSGGQVPDQGAGDGEQALQGPRHQHRPGSDGQGGPCSHLALRMCCACACPSSLVHSLAQSLSSRCFPPPPSTAPLTTATTPLLQQPMLEWLANSYKKFGCLLEFVTDRSEEGNQFCKGFGGIGGVLRYSVRGRGDVLGGGQGLGSAACRQLRASPNPPCCCPRVAGGPHRI